MLELLNEYLVQEALVVIPVLLILGKVIKGTDVIKDKFIPVTLLVVGIAFAVALIGFNVNAIIQGFLVAGGAVYGHEFYKQTRKDD